MQGRVKSQHDQPGGKDHLGKGNIAACFLGLVQQLVQSASPHLVGALALDQENICLWAKFFSGPGFKLLQSLKIYKFLPHDPLLLLQPCLHPPTAACPPSLKRLEHEKWDFVPSKVDKTYDDVESTYFHSDQAILRIFNDKTNRYLEPAGFSRIHNRTFSCLPKKVWDNHSFHSLPCIACFMLKYPRQIINHNWLPWLSLSTSTFGAPKSTSTTFMWPYLKWNKA